MGKTTRNPTAEPDRGWRSIAGGEIGGGSVHGGSTKKNTF